MRHVYAVANTLAARCQNVNATLYGMPFFGAIKEV